MALAKQSLAGIKPRPVLPGRTTAGSFAAAGVPGAAAMPVSSPHITKPLAAPTAKADPSITRPSRFSNARIVLALALAGPLAFGLAFAGVGFFSAFPPVVIGSVVCALVAAAVLAVHRRWMAMIGTVAAGLMLALAASDPTPGSWIRPSLGLQMSWGHAARLAGIVGLAAGIVEFRQPRGQARPTAQRSVTLVAVLALGLAVGVGGTTTAALADRGFASGDEVVAVEPDAVLRIREENDRFELVSGEVRAGQLVRIVVENHDEQIHSFTTTADPAIDVDNLGSRTTTILARAPQAGTWHYVCKYHPGMEADISVGA